MNRIKTSLMLLSFPLAASFTQTGEPYIHDPSTIAYCGDKYYTFGTGGGGLISSDGWTWHSGAVRPGGGAAPDVMKIGDRYLVIYGATGGGLGGGHNGRILTMWNKTLDPSSPDFKFSEPIEVAASDGIEDNDAIDPGLLLDPTTGRLWVCYGTYFGNIRLIELNPNTGERVQGNEPIDIAIDCEATDLIYRDGWYYLLGTHGTCCDGVNSTYNIIVGRSRNVTGPYIDNIGRPMLQGGGRMVLAAGDRLIGPGHFGRTIIDEGVEVIIANGKRDNIILDLLDDTKDIVCTRFLPDEQVSSVKKWIAHSEGFCKGEIKIDAGAEKAILADERCSILSVGVISVSGKFEKGDIIRVVSESGEQIALGKTDYSNEEVAEIIGKKGDKPVIHCDYLYVL
jgi:predicted ribosome-associated RNA-binding protein Tma20